MPITVFLPSRNVELEFPDSMTEQEIAAAIEQEYPRSGEDVAYEVEQAKTATIEGQDLVNPFEGMSNDDYALFRKHLAEKKTSLGDALGIAADTFGTIVSEVGKAAGATGEAVLGGEFGAAGESAVEGMVAGTVGLADIADKIFQPARTIPSKEEFLKRPIAEMGYAFGPGSPSLSQRPATEADYAALIEQEKQRDAEATNRLYAMEATLRGAPIEEVARGFQYVDPTLLASLGGTAAAKLAGKTLFKGAARTAATQAATTASTAPGAIGQAALAGVERAAGAVEAVAGLPRQALDLTARIAEGVAPGIGAGTKGAAIAGAAMTDLGLTAGTIAGAQTAEKAAEVLGSVARAARQEASRAGLLERAAMDAGISPAARKVAAGLAQIQPGISTAGRLTAQAAKEGAAGAVVGSGLGYLAEGNLEGAAAGAGAGAAIGGLSGTLRSSFDLGREMLGKSTSRTREQATGDLNRFLGERPEVEQAAWGETINRLVKQVGPERAASQVDAMRIAEANGARVRVATPDEMKQWQNPGWLNVDGMEVVLNPSRILGDTASHETAHVLFSSVINRAFRPEIETAIFGLADPVTGEIVRPGLFDDADLAKVADQIGDSYGTNTQAASEFRGYANVLRNSTDSASLQNARTRIADEMTAAYTGRLFNRIRPGRFNPDRLPLAYRKALNALEDGILDKFRSVLFEKGMDLGFDAPSRTFRDSKGKPIRIPELDAIVKRAMAKKGTKEATAPKAKPDLIPTNPADRVIWARSYGGARGILNDDGTPKSEAQVNAEAAARWQDMTQRMAALPENERIGIEFSRDKTGKTVMTAKGQISPTAINAILDSGALDPSAKAVLRDVLVAMQDPNKSTFDTRYYGVYTRGRGGNRMIAGVKSASQNEILPYSVEMNSKDGVIIRAVDMTKVRERLETAMNKPQFKSLYGSPADALKDFNRYLENITQVNPVESAMLLGGGEKGAKKRNLFYEALGFRLRNGESLVNAPESAIGKSQNTIKSYRVERFAKLQKTGFAFPFEEATTYERAMRNFQPDAFTRETLPNGEAMTNPDGYRILKKTGSKLFRVYNDKGELLGTSSTEQAAIRKAQSDFAKKTTKEEKQTRFQPVTPEQDAAYLNAVKAGDYVGVAKRLVELGIWVENSRWTPGERSVYGAPTEYSTEYEISKFADRHNKFVQHLESELEKFKNPLKPSRENFGDNKKAYYDALNHWKQPPSKTAIDAFESQIKTHKLAAKNALIIKEWVSKTGHGFISEVGSGSYYFYIPGRNKIRVSNHAQPGQTMFGVVPSINTAVNEYLKNSTYDDAGNVIPLSQRFNPESPDIRFQPSSLTARDINTIAKEVGGGEVKGGAKKFGAFMREMRDKGITIRDVVKSYGITLSSIQRQELLAQTIKKNWPDAPFKDGEKIRPEDAFATLLGTKEGQEYLNSAEMGEFNEPAADVMMQKFKSFGFQNKLKEQMKVAAEEFFPKAQSIIDAVNNMPAEQFAEFVRSNVRGISYGKIGFWSGHLGRGDIPTFDSRMGKLVYGKEVPVSKKVLMEQKERLPMLGISVPDEFKDFAQTLLHHEVWDRLNKSDTEHAPIKEAMIRFQPDSASPNIQVGSNGTRIIKSPSGKFRVYSVTGTLLGIRDSEQAAKKLATK